MQSKINNQQFWSSDSPLAEPHFDQEATLLSARPVVPIEKLTVKPGFSRPWVFGFALAGALLLGVSATALYYSQFRTTGSQPVLNFETVSSGATGVVSEAVALDDGPKEATEGTDLTRAGSLSVESDTPVTVKAPATSDSWTTQPLNSSNAVSKKPVRRPATVVVDQTSETEYETRERRGAKRVVVDQGAESEYETLGERRRARREAQEQKRANRERRGGKRSDELLRIREIFEGSPRP